MIYSNPEFFALLLGTLALYLGLPFQRARSACLLLSSLTFLAWVGLFDLAIFLAVVVVAWGSLFLSERFPRFKQPIAGAAVAILLTNLFFWKYSGWVAEELSLALGLGHVGWAPALPIGISFFTLQGVAYLVDYRRGKQAYVSFSSYILFKGLFAHLIAGPIVRGDELLPALRRLETPTAKDLSKGIALFGIGLAKKLIIADRLAPWVDPVFASPSSYDATSLWLAAIGFTFQIWADFSGYTDMGRGAARLFGIGLPENFLSPYLSRGPAEFWRRWHITLSEWIRDYLFTPMALAAMRQTTAHFFGAVLLSMTVCGLWHGASWTMLLFGLYHGALLVGERLLAPMLRRVPSVGFLAVPVTFCLVTLGFVLFRCSTIKESWIFFEGLFGLGPAGSLSIGNLALFLALAPLCVGYQLLTYCDLRTRSMPHFARLVSITQSSFQWLERRVGAAGVGALAGVGAAAYYLLTLFLRAGSNSSRFIYFQF